MKPVVTYSVEEARMLITLASGEPRFSRSQFYSLVKRGEVPSFKVASRWLITERALKEWTGNDD